MDHQKTLTNWLLYLCNISFFMCPAFSFSFFCNTTFLYRFCERTDTPLNCLLLFFRNVLFPSLCVFFPFHSIYWSDGVTSWLPGVGPELQVCCPEVAELSVTVEGDSRLMKYQYFTLLIYCRLTKHDTILSNLGNVCLCLCSFLPLWWQKARWKQ